MPCEPIRSDLLAKHDETIAHGFFTRQGGVSDGVFKSLNMGFRNADDPTARAQNHERVARTLGVPPSNLLIARQVHGDTCLVVDEPFSNDARPEADALVTNVSGLAIGVLSADCVPILAFDPKARVVGCAHAGWKGAKIGIANSMVRSMCGLGAEPDNIVAVIGPAIAQISYEVGQGFKAEFLASHSESGVFFKEGGNGRPHFDLPGFVGWSLRRSGAETVAAMGRDTCAEDTVFFSNRRALLRGEDGFGLQVSAIALR